MNPLNKEDFKKLKPAMLLITYAVFLIFGILAIPGFGLFLAKLFRLFMPLFYAIGIAFVLNIPMRIFEKLLKKWIPNKNWFYNKIRGIAVVLTLIFAALVLYVLFSIIAPQIVSSLQLLLKNATNYITSILTNFNTVLEFFNLDKLNITLDNQSINEFVKQFNINWESIVKNMSNWAIGTGTSLINNVFAFTGELANWFTGFMLSLYLLSSKEKFIRQFRKLIAAIFGYKLSLRIFKIGTESNRIFNSFISGQLVEACILGCIYFVVLSLLNIPFAMLISCVIAITSIIPMFGAMFGMAFGCLLILAVRPLLDVVWFVIIFQAVQTFEGNVIYPRVVGNSVGLPGIWVLLSIIILGSIWGLFGMLIAVPFTAVCYNLLSEFVNYRLKKQQLIVTTDTLEKAEEKISES
ncbi:AI-2E family transporter [Anaerorhabdus sp.]|uniref:AI-2E family transporter n=1 Tax=Anaerorhabdus sp. TaxID=1872524 RepID=UPI002B2101B0|nr:AI-2E family transporter [Anaerorhabdus sp.]MEA4874571.1 AI-2E family transporter [Anaerorhabdus sp.]